jgi:predicted glycoside hydrolase/deacetylase ChbG (UPF0249 family)
MTTTPRIILTSDDFGLSSVYNEKILEMLRLEFLTSVSVLVERISGEQTKQIDELINFHSKMNVSIGLHLELNDSELLTDVQRQFLHFNDFFGFEPEYIDIHKNSQFNGDYNILAEFCNIKHIAFRKYPSTTCFVASPYLSVIATKMDIESIEKMIDNFTSKNIYEIVFHIGTYDPNSSSTLNRERELDALKLIRVNQLIKQKRLAVTNYKGLINGNS